MSSPCALRVAVISDLHIGTKARATELCPHRLDPATAAARNENFLEKFADLTSSEKFAARGPVDALLVTGDITNSGHASEHKRASEIIHIVAQRLGISDDMTFFVPGNHDVFWPVAKLVPSDFWRKYRYDPMHAKENAHIHATFQRKVHGRFDSEPFAAIWECGNLLVLGINSAAHDGPEEPDVHHGSVTPNTLQWIDETLNLYVGNRDMRRICLIHHHPLQYPNPTGTSRDFSALQNAESLLALLCKYRVDILVHGHRHVPQWTFRHDATFGHPIGILGAGTFCAALDNQWTGSVTNQFHIVEFEASRPHHVSQGRVMSWAYDSAIGWRPSSQDLGMRAVRRFGDRRTIAELVGVLTTCLTANQSQPFVRFSVAESSDPILAFCDDEVVVRACHDAAAATGFEFSGNMNLHSDRSQWLFIQRVTGP